MNPRATFLTFPSGSILVTPVDLIPDLMLLTSVALACDAALHGLVELQLLVQDFLLPLVELGPEVALHVGGQRLLALWVDAATLHGAPVDEYSGAALFEAIKMMGDAFLDRAVKAQVAAEVWTSVMNIAIKEDAIAIVETLHKRLPSVAAPQARDIAARVGSVRLLHWLTNHDVGGPATLEAVVHAARTGNQAVLEWILNHEVDSSDLSASLDVCSTLSRAASVLARRGNLELLRWLLAHHEERFEVSTAALAHALLTDHYEVAEWLLQLYASKYEDAPTLPFTNDLQMALCDAFDKGDVAKLEWMRSHGLLKCPKRKHVDRAKINGHVHVLDFIETHFPKAKSLTAFYAYCAAGGSIEAARWAFERKRLTCTPQVIHAAARHGHMDFICWYTTVMHDGLAKMSVTYRMMDPNTVHFVAANGHLEVLQWLVRNEYAQLNARCASEAAMQGHLETLRWLVTQHKHRPTVEAMDEAAANGHLDVLKFMQTHGLPCGRDAIVGAARNGHMAVVQWLDRTITLQDVSRALVEATQCGQLRVVQYLLSRNKVAGLATRLVRTAQCWNHVRLARWIERYATAEAEAA